MSKRELEVLRLIGAGHTSRKIARLLQISFYTVETHKRRAFFKLGATDRANAVALAYEKGLLMVGEIDFPFVPNSPD